MRWMRCTLVFAGAAVAACGGRDDAKEAARDTMGGMAMDTSRMGDMQTRGGMAGMQMMSGMRAHMDSMMSTSPDRMKAMMAEHDRMTAQMMDRMGADMRGMNMAVDPEWNALADSVRADLAALPGLEGQQLTARMRAHAERVGRLVAKHERMMGSMAKP
ncbi:MAG: hypothetical protein ACREOC_12455 [Gemmatimonadales bacterium]